MSASQRRKGAVFERMVAFELNEAGYTAKRNLDQYQEKGLGDARGLPGIMLECKRYKTATHGQIEAWWEETKNQANDEGQIPVLCYRADRQPAYFVIAGAAAAGEFVPYGVQEGDPVDPSVWNYDRAIHVPLISFIEWYAAVVSEAKEAIDEKSEYFALQGRTVMH